MSRAFVEPSSLHLRPAHSRIPPNFIDCELETVSPRKATLAQVPYPSANPEAALHCWSNHGEDYVEPHVVARRRLCLSPPLRNNRQPKYLRWLSAAPEPSGQNFQALSTNFIPPGPTAVFPLATCRLEGARACFPTPPTFVEPIMSARRTDSSSGDTVFLAKKSRSRLGLLMNTPAKYRVGRYFEDVQPALEHDNVIPLELGRSSYCLLKKIPTGANIPENGSNGEDHAEVAKYIVHGRNRHPRTR